MKRSKNCHFQLPRLALAVAAACVTFSGAANAAGEEKNNNLPNGAAMSRSISDPGNSLAMNKGAVQEEKSLTPKVPGRRTAALVSKFELNNNKGTSHVVNAFPDEVSRDRVAALRSRFGANIDNNGVSQAARSPSGTASRGYIAVGVQLEANNNLPPQVSSSLEMTSLDHVAALASTPLVNADSGALQAPSTPSEQALRAHGAGVANLPTGVARNRSFSSPENGSLNKGAVHEEKLSTPKVPGRRTAALVSKFEVNNNNGTSHAVNASPDEVSRDRVALLASRFEDNDNATTQVVNSAVGKASRDQVALLASRFEGNDNTTSQVVNSAVGKASRDHVALLASQFEGNNNTTSQVLNSAVDKASRDQVELLASHFERNNNTTSQVVNSAVGKASRDQVALLASQFEGNNLETLQAVNIPSDTVAHDKVAEPASKPMAKAKNEASQALNSSSDQAVQRQNETVELHPERAPTNEPMPIAVAGQGSHDVYSAEAQRSLQSSEIIAEDVQGRRNIAVVGPEEPQEVGNALSAGRVNNASMNQVNSTGGTANRYVVIDENKAMTLSSQPRPDNQVALTLTNRAGSTSGIVIEEDQVVISGGSQSTSMTLNESGASFNNSKTGAPVVVSGVAAGVGPNDATNVAQVHEVVNAAVDPLSGRLEGVENQVQRLDQKIAAVEKKLSGGVAMSMAMSQPFSFAPQSRSAVTGGIATYNGQSAVGFSFNRLLVNTQTRRTVISLAVAATTSGRSSASARAGASFSW